MRLLHTADWHLGRSLHGVRLLEDQAYVLQQIINIAREWRPDVIIVAGDVYDRSMPPGDAIELLDTTLSELILGLRTRVVIIAGNHDGSQWLSFGSRLLTASGLHIFGALQAGIEAVSLHDNHGTVAIYAMPYADPAIARERLQEPTIVDHSGAAQAWITQALQNHPSAVRAICVAHAFVAGGQPSDSERQLAVGGTGLIPVSHFGSFHYTALGHLHAPQSLGAGRVHYSGSLLKYSISEIDHVKSVNLVELDAQGNCTVERTVLRPLRDVRRIAGKLDDLLRAAPDAAAQDDYIVARLLDDGPLVDPMNRLRQVYPQIIHLERPAFSVSGEPCEPGLLAPGRRIEDLFAGFYSAMTSVNLTDEQAALFAAVMDGTGQAEQEEQHAPA